MLGHAAVAMWWDIAPEMRAEWEEWHSTEHMPERLAIPGFLRGTRWIALSGEASYFVLYEAASLATLTAGPYVERLNDPSPWSRKMMPCHRNMVRSLCLVRDGYGGGVARMLATVRLSRAPTAELPRDKGLTGAHFLESQPTSAVPQTTEQRIRGGDATAEWVLLVGGYEESVVRSACVRFGGVADFYRPAYSLSPGEIA